MLCPLSHEYADNLEEEANKLAKQLSEAQPLTKNQKRRLREKRKKQAKQASEGDAGAQAGAAPAAGDVTDASVATTPSNEGEAGAAAAAAAAGEGGNGTAGDAAEAGGAEAPALRPPTGIAALCAEGPGIGAKVVDLGMLFVKCGWMGTRVC